MQCGGADAAYRNRFHEHSRQEETSSLLMDGGLEADVPEDPGLIDRVPDHAWRPRTMMMGALKEMFRDAEPGSE